MRILVEILHPAHVHVFRNAIAEWKRRGDDVLVLSREKDCANALLEAYDIPYESISAIGKTRVRLGSELLRRIHRMWKAARRFQPDLLVGVMGVTIAPVGRLIGRPAVVFYDTENAGITNRVVYPLAHSVCTPDCYQGPVRGRQVRYPGYHELAYLHPDHFAPDSRVLQAVGLQAGEAFVLLRFVSWQASHDIGERRISLERKRDIVRELSARARVLISSEGTLPEDLQSFRVPLPVAMMHHLMAHATLLLGESATMASEAAVLGVPSVLISDTGRGYTDEQERRYGLVRRFRTAETDEALAQAREWLDRPDLHQWAAGQRQQLLADKCNSTSWMLAYLDRVLGQPHA